MKTAADYPINYRELLKKYIEYVAEVESVYLLPHTPNEHWSEEELDELYSLKDELRKELLD